MAKVRFLYSYLTNNQDIFMSNVAITVNDPSLTGIGGGDTAEVERIGR